MRAIVSGDLSEVGELLSKRGKGLVKSLRSGELDDQGEKLKDALSTAKMVGSRAMGGRKLVVLDAQNGKKKIQFTVIREDGKQVIDEITIQTPSNKARK